VGREENEEEDENKPRREWVIRNGRRQTQQPAFFTKAGSS
jgi:hypothetical protein